MFRNRAMQMTAVTVVTVAGFVSACLAQQTPAAPADSAGVDSVLKLIPANAQAAVVIPDLKTLSDQITQLLEGMDRANLLLGSRPLDQLKAATGFNIGINDAGGLAIVMLSAQQENPKWAFVVPVSDADAFLKGNFTAHEGNSYTMANGTTVYAKSLQSHVVLSTQQDVAASYDPQGGIAQSLTSSLGDRGVTVMHSGELFVFGKQEAFNRALSAATQGAANRGIPLPGEEIASLPILQQIDVGIRSLDFDPLGLISRSMQRFKPESAAAKISGAAPVTHALGALPNKPYYFAISADVAGLGGQQGIDAMMQALGVQHQLPNWIAQTQGLQFAAYPSPAGVTGGIFNDAALVIRTSEPDQVKQALKQQISTLQQQPNAPGMTVTWQNDKKVNDAVGNADAYEIKNMQQDENDFVGPMIWSNLFGQSGWRGYLAETPNAVVMTFSQRPAVLEAALKAQVSDEHSLSSDAAIKSMSEMMPPGASVQAYVGVAQVLQLVKQIASSFGQKSDFPEVDANLPPIGFGAAVRDRGVETATIVPAGVIAIAIDQAMKQRQMPNNEEQSPSTSQPAAGAPSRSY